MWVGQVLGVGLVGNLTVQGAREKRKEGGKERWRDATDK